MKKPDPVNINTPKKENPIENNSQNPSNFTVNIPKNLPIKKIEPPKMSSRGEPHQTPISTVTPSDFTDLLDLEDPVELKNRTNADVPQKSETENLANIQNNEKKNDEEEKKTNNAFAFDFNFLSKNEPRPKKDVDQIDILFG